PALALEFTLGKRCITRQFVHQREQRLCKFRKSRKRDRTIVRTRTRRKIGADAPQIFFELPARTLHGSRAHDRGGHLRESRSAVQGRRVSGLEKEFAVKF